MPKGNKKSKGKKEMFVRICPRCGSTRTIRTFSNKYISYYYFCQDCNFESPLFPEISSKELKKLPEMSPAPRYLMWRRPTTAEVKPLERAVEKKTTDSLTKAIYVFLIILIVLIFILAII